MIFAVRVVRLAAYGLLSVVLVLYLAAPGLTELRIGLLLTLSLVGDSAVSLWMNTWADHAGLANMPLFLAGGPKIVYDLALS